MKLLQSICLLLFVSLSLSVKAQIKDDVVSDKDSLSFMQKNFFHTIGGTLLFEFVWAPSSPYIAHTGAGYFQSYHQVVGFSMISCTYDPRINLYNFGSRASVSFNTPVSFGLTIFDPGTFSLVVPAVIDFNFLNHSTYNNIDRYGFHLGGGYQYLLAPMIGGNPERIVRSWTAPVIRAGINGPWKNRIMFLNFSWSPGRLKYDEYEEREFKDYQYFKIVLGTVLGYE